MFGDRDLGERPLVRGDMRLIAVGLKKAGGGGSRGRRG
jgi:hypothetical protein